MASDLFQSLSNLNFNFGQIMYYSLKIKETLNKVVILSASYNLFFKKDCICLCNLFLFPRLIGKDLYVSYLLSYLMTPVY